MPADGWGDVPIEELIWMVTHMNAPRFIKLTQAASGLPCYVLPVSVVAVTQEHEYSEVLVDRGLRFTWHVRETAAEIIAMIDPPKETTDAR